MLDIRQCHPLPDASDISCLHLAGRLDDEGAATLEQALQKESEAAPSSDAHTLILDLQELEYLSSDGLRVLLQIHKSFEAGGGRVLLCAPSPFVRQVLDLSGMARVLHIVNSLDAALQGAQSPPNKHWSRDTEKGRLSFTPGLDGQSCLELWEETARESMFQTSLAELGICLGHGGFGTRREQAQENRGIIFTAVNVAALLPDGVQGQPAFITTRYPSETVVYVSRGASLCGEPSGCLDFQATQSVSLGWLLHELQGDLFPAEAPLGENPSGVCACLLFVEEFVPSAQDGTPTPGALLFCLHYHGPRKNDLPAALASLPWRRDGELNCCVLALTLHLPPDAPCTEPPMRTLDRICDLENLHTVLETGPEARFHQARAWIWRPTMLRSAQEKRLQIDCPEGVELPPAWDVITRRLYAASNLDTAAARLSLVPLRPFLPRRDPALFLVYGQDVQGAPLPASLLELDTAERIRAGREAFQHRVAPSITANAAVPEDHALHNEQGGQRYGLAPGETPATQLTTLAQLYASKPVAELLPLFDRLCTEVLKPWYGRPVLDSLRLWHEHDPRRRFPTILGDAERELGLDPDAPLFDSPELGRPVCNPFHVLAHEFSLHAEESAPWYICTIHGDLNLHNVLVDEEQRFHLVGFHATRRGNAVADFARLEPVLLLEYARLANDSESDALARFIETWYAAPSYAAVPPFGYAGSDPRISRAYQVLRRLRGYADTVTLFENDTQPYLLAVLEWTLPAVTFQDWEPERKRLAAIMAGVLCERILGNLPS